MQKSDHPSTEKKSLSKWVSHLLDDLIPIPGTKKRIGLDPIIGMIPGFGDVTTSAIGLTLLGQGLKQGVKKSVYLRMISNWTLNALVGAIPFLGDLFSFWFKSNQRNHRLLKAHLDSHSTRREQAQGWGSFAILVIVAISVFALIGVVATYGLHFLINLF